ncbi:hypothetical protein [Rhizobium leguminosarum]|uniref:hypothetical protein n=1 Tax=Rhizobium leguminosarum TaxID=384 RepID=UPI0013EED0BB|nr:hypothetical protein [Rhizobium leguminosarum]
MAGQLRTATSRYQTNNSNQKPLERTQNWIKLGGKVNIRAGAADALACIAPSMNAFLSSAFMGGGRGVSHS